MQKDHQNYKILVSKDHMQLKEAKATLDVSRGRIEATIQPKETLSRKIC